MPRPRARINQRKTGRVFPPTNRAVCGMHCLHLLGGLAVFALLTLPPGAPLRNPDTGELIGNSPFMNGLIAFIMVMFLATGAAYGIGRENDEKPHRHHQSHRENTFRNGRPDFPVPDHQPICRLL